jgi:hypothetical protein
VKQLQLDAVPVSVAFIGKQVISVSSVATSLVSLSSIYSDQALKLTSSAILIPQDAVAVRHIEIASALIVYKTRIL